MSIMWKYLDKRSAAIAAVKDYENMCFIIESTDEEIRQTHEKMRGLSSTKWDGMPRTHNPKAAEDRIVDGIEEIDILRERYRQAVEYMNWFEPAWGQLSEEDQYVLKSFYSNNDYGAGAVERVADYFSIERTSAYKRKNRAIDRLTVLLFGKP